MRQLLHIDRVFDVCKCRDSVVSLWTEFKNGVEEMTGLVALCNGNGVVPEEVQGVNSLETGLVGNDQIKYCRGQQRRKLCM